MKKLYISGVIFIISISFIHGQNNSGNNQVKLTGKDSAFIKQAESGGMMEVTLGRIAEKNASSDAVKQFGEKMVKDDSTANNKLDIVAKKDHLPIVSKMNVEDQSTVDNLKDLRGEKFDQRYMANMVGDHEADIQNFETGSQNVYNKDLKNWINNTLPTLKEHLKLAKKIYDEIKK